MLEKYFQKKKKKKKKKLFINFYLLIIKIVIIKHIYISIPFIYIYNNYSFHIRKK